MPRRLATLAAVASLVLCVATVALWVRSYWSYDAVYYLSVSERLWALESLKGQVAYLSFSNETMLGHGFTYASAPSATLGGPLLVSGRLGFGLVWPDARVISGVSGGVAGPHWFLALLLAILPALRLRAVIRSRRIRRGGLCPTCGYDLRATPDRCPECGAVPAARAGGAAAR